jgi:hypothetical protein
MNIASNLNASANIILNTYGMTPLNVRDLQYTFIPNLYISQKKKSIRLISATCFKASFARKSGPACFLIAELNANP